MGLGLVAVVFTVFNAFFFRADAVRNPGELFTVQRVPHAGANVWIPFTRRQLLSGAGRRSGGRTHVDTCRGRALRPAVIVLSRRGWTKLFADDTMVIGRTVLVNGAPAEIVGIMPENFHGLAPRPGCADRPFG